MNEEPEGADHTPPHELALSASIRYCKYNGNRNYEKELDRGIRTRVGGRNRR